MTTERRDRLKVLYVIGWGRSGSTLLDTLLGEVDGFFSSGELYKIWQEGLTEGRKCGCGRPVVACPVWSEVLAGIFPDPSSLNLAQITRWHNEELRTRDTWRVMRASSGDRVPSRAVLRYADIMERLYRKVGEVTGAEVVVDSSKVPSNAALLELMTGIEPYILQLVRDPRASAFSWQRQRARLDLHEAERMPRFGLTKSSLNWLAFNAAGEALRRRHPRRSYLLRYEDLVAKPRDAVGGIVRFVGGTDRTLPFAEERIAHLRENHTVSGNPSRFSTGRIEIREDDEWKRSQSPSQRAFVVALSLPLLRRYRYPIRVA